jgi:hypothetical protein
MLRSFVPPIRSISLIALGALIVAFGPGLTRVTDAATSGPWVKSRAVAGPVAVQGGAGNVTVATLGLSPSAYLVQAKLVAVPNPAQGTIKCTLALGPSQDSSSAYVTYVGRTTISMMVTGSLASQSQATVKCTFGDPVGAGEQFDLIGVRVIATRLGSLLTV